MAEYEFPVYGWRLPDMETIIIVNGNMVERKTMDEKQSEVQVQRNEDRIQEILRQALRYMVAEETLDPTNERQMRNARNAILSHLRMAERCGFSTGWEEGVSRKIGTPFPEASTDAFIEHATSGFREPVLVDTVEHETNFYRRKAAEIGLQLNTLSTAVGAILESAGWVWCGVHDKWFHRDYIGGEDERAQREMPMAEAIALHFDLIMKDLQSGATYKIPSQWNKDYVEKLASYERTIADILEKAGWEYEADNKLWYHPDVSGGAVTEGALILTVNRSKQNNFGRFVCDHCGKPDGVGFDLDVGTYRCKYCRECDDIRTRKLCRHLYLFYNGVQDVEHATINATIGRG